MFSLINCFELIQEVEMRCLSFVLAAMCFERTSGELMSFEVEIVGR
jgi:hypothetical protein